MVDLSPVLAMAAPSDPLSHQLQHQHSAHNNNTNPNLITSPWGTWEELLLGSAVLKHGADNWALVSEELQSRARASFSFTPEACRAGYHAIQLRFGADAGRGGGNTQWYEELRRLRVAHLKRELEQYDNSIGSLESKIKRLQSEGEVAQSSHAEEGRSESNEVPCEPTLKGPTDEYVACGSKKPCSNMAMTSEVALMDGSIDPEDGHGRVTTSDIIKHHTSDTGPDTPDPTATLVSGADARAKQSNGVKRWVDDEATGSLSQHCISDKEPTVNGNGSFHAKQEEQPQSSSSTLYLSLSKSNATTSKNMIVEQEKSNRDPISSLNVKQEGGGIESSLDAVDKDYVAPDTTPENNNRTSTSDRMTDDGGDPAHGRLALQPDASRKVGDALRGDASAKRAVSPSLKSVNIEECKNKAYGDDDNGGRKSDESQSLCSPRFKSLHVKRRRSSDGGGPGFSREGCSQFDLDDKRYVRKVLGEKSFVEAMSNLPVESADSTEGKGRRALAMKVISPDAVAARVKKEMVTCKEEIDILPGSSRDDKDASRKHVGAPMNTERKNQSTSSTENSLREVWGESAEVVNKEMKQPCKRRRLMGRVDKKRKAADTEGARGTATQVSPMKTESLTLSQEASESMQSPGGKEEHDIEAWNQVERLSGDSRYEKSEVGSYVDGNEDISPMSRRHRREPKVSGKLIPLLESLRTICAHRCGHFFRHSQESEENDMYYHIVRAPIDLGMIRSKLEDGQYSGSMHFFRDLLLMVNNALVYYPRDSSESAAASGLRECVIKEMGHVFETEALVKQEGPSFRKRDNKQLLSQGRRKGCLKLLSTMERMSRERDRALKQSDVSTSIESRRMSHQSFASRLCEGGWTDKGIDAKMSVNTGVDVPKIVESLECKRLINNQTTPEVSSSLKSGLSPSVKASETKELLRVDSTSGKAHDSKEPASKEPKLKDRSSENVIEKKTGFANVGYTSKNAALASLKGKESGNHKVKAAPNIVQEPVKRGVGRPPKHSQQQNLLKAREVLEVTHSTRKRSRR